MSQRIHGPCLVCGSPAVGINFTVPTCAPCKAFFRRNAVKLGRIDFVCQKDGDCPVTESYRRICNCCRLAKCFRVGMKKSLIRSDAEKEARRQLVLQNRQKRTELESHKQLEVIRPPNLLVSTYSHSNYLSSSDQALLTNIYSAYERTYLATSSKEHPYFPSKLHSSVHALFNEYSKRHMSLIEFFKLIPEINRISLNDRIRLIKNHFGTMFTINESISKVNEHSTLLTFKNVFGTDIAMDLYRCFGLKQAYSHDPLLTKLLLIVRSLSCSISRNRYDRDMNRVYDDTRTIFSVQNVYVELLWKYILSRLPSERDAVKLFNKIVMDLIFIVRVCFIVDSFVYNMPDEIEQMNSLMQKMAHNKSHGQCLVCDDVAIGINFGVPTCMPCKAFFRRNALRLGIQQFVCMNDGDCLISYKYRRSCNCCRLAKCFRVGMKKSLILSDEEREARNKLVEMNRLKRGKLPKRECAKWMLPPTLHMITNTSIRYLSAYDEATLSNIYNAYANTCTVAKNALSKTLPAAQCTSLHEYINELSIEFQSCIEFLKCIPEFSRITTDDKLRLIKNHFSILVNVNGPMIQPVPLNRLVITWTNVFGIDITQRLLKSNQLLEPYIYDPFVLKILLIILALSSSNGRNLDNIDIDQICDDSLTIFAAQNIYVELLWKYLLSRSASEQNAVRFFNKLMMCILYVKNLDMDIDVYVRSLAHEIQQADPIMQSMWSRTAEVEEITDMNVAENITI
ncbi:unnamed protein product [Adineta steineri]|uniref:Nuclear receptor domain-containing protein n=1 Tax=Adineta steineri TaxID=433720 RepID=A0A813XU97_9BILA|nr:unnamed protein product [Adineta steineri]